MSTYSLLTLSEKPEKGTATPQRDRAYRALRQLLILQQIEEGARISEPVWASRLEVNRMALREALARLEVEGLVEKGEKTGYVVPKLSEEDVREILSVRLALELAAIEQICAQGKTSKHDLQPLHEACDQLDHLISQGYLLGASEADRRFHETLIDLPQNRRLSMVYHRSPLQMIHNRIVQTDHWLQECIITLNEHRAIAKAIGENNPAEAQALLREHLSERFLLPLREGS